MALSVLPSVLLAVVLFLLYRARHGQRSAQYPLPPGPPGLPLLGNVFDVPSMPTWVTYKRWSGIYGSPIIRLTILGQNYIIVNTYRAMMDLLEKKSAIYSDRPRFTMLNELSNFSWSIAHLRYGRDWRIRRKLFHSHFNPQTSKLYRSIEERATHQFLGRLEQSPDQFMSHVRLLAGALIADLAYGFKVKDHDNLYLRTSEQASSCLRETAHAGSFLVDMLPILRYIPEWFPGAGFQRKARLWASSVGDVPDIAFKQYQENTSRGESSECIATSLIESLRSYGDKDAPFTEEDVKDVLATIYVGSDTTVSTIQSFLLAMVLHPEIQVRAQADIDRLCPDRLPTFDNYDGLPYVEAIVREALRWNPVLPESLPHAVTEDDIYGGYFIPKGSIIVTNSWALLHDEEYYPDPLRFNPDRFVTDGVLNCEVHHPDVAAFGYGRRICPGRFMAQDSIWIAVATILAAFNIRPAKDAEGKPDVPSGEYILGTLCAPKPFRCEIHPRTERHRAWIQSISSE